MTQKQSLEGKIIFVDNHDLGSAVKAHLKRKVEIVANSPGSIIQKLRENNTDDVHAIVLTYSPKMNYRLELYLNDLTRIIEEARSLGYDDSQIVVYSSVSVIQALGGTLILPFRYDDAEALIKYLNKSR